MIGTRDKYPDGWRWPDPDKTPRPPKKGGCWGRGISKGKIKQR